MKGFIEVTQVVTAGEEKLTLIQVGGILMMADHEIVLVNDGTIKVVQTYDEIKTLIAAALV